MDDDPLGEDVLVVLDRRNAMIKDIVSGIIDLWQSSELNAYTRTELSMAITSLMQASNALTGVIKNPEGPDLDMNYE